MDIDPIEGGEVEAKDHDDKQKRNSKKGHERRYRSRERTTSPSDIEIISFNDKPLKNPRRESRSPIPPLRVRSASRKSRASMTPPPKDRRRRRKSGTPCQDEAQISPLSSEKR